MKCLPEWVLYHGLKILRLETGVGLKRKTESKKKKKQASMKELGQ